MAESTKGLSAGRVQSVAARMICDREKEIQDFKPEEYWTLKGIFFPTISNAENSETIKENFNTDSNKEVQLFEASLYGLKKKKLKLKTKEEIDSIMSALENAEYYVEKIQRGQRKRNAPPPFTTSTLQQEASRKLGFSTKKTMMLAQQLYEGVDIKDQGSIALITYMRTDSTRISADAQSAARADIAKKYGKEYVPKKPNEFSSKKNVQDAHEAIRPTYINWTPDKLKESLKRDQLRLYRLIYERFLASQMTPALYEVMTIHIKAGDYTFRATGSRNVFPGYTVVYMEGNDTEKEEKDINLPILNEGQKLFLKEWKPEQHFTQPPPRYTEASLVRALEDMGIGRPSTYAPTISTILSRGYVNREGKVLHPTELGILVNDLMKEYFPNIMDYQFTAEMEEKLDMVEEGKIEWRSILEEFYDPFKKYLEHADKSMEKIEMQDEVSDVVCKTVDVIW